MALAQEADLVSRANPRTSKRRDGGMPNEVYVYMKLTSLAAMQNMGFKSAEGDKSVGKNRKHYRDLPKSKFAGVYPTPRGIWTGRYRNRSCGVFYEEADAAMGRDTLLVCMHHRQGISAKTEQMNYPDKLQDIMSSLEDVGCVYAGVCVPPSHPGALSAAD